MSSRVFAILAVTLLTVASLSGCATVKAHHRMFFGQPGDPISGKWKVTFYDNGTALPATFVLKRDADKISGSVYADKIGEGAIRDGKWSAGSLSFTVDFKAHKSLLVEGRLENGDLHGQCHHPDGPTFKWQATRAAADDAISGDWQVTFHVHEMTMPATFNFKAEGANVTGTVYSDHTGAGTIREGKYADGKLNFTVDFTKHESIVVKGTMTEGKLTGEFSTEGFTDKWEAVRK